MRCYFCGYDAGENADCPRCGSKLEGIKDPGAVIPSQTWRPEPTAHAGMRWTREYGCGGASIPQSSCPPSYTAGDEVLTHVGRNAPGTPPLGEADPEQAPLAPQRQRGVTEEDEPPGDTENEIGEEPSGKPPRRFFVGPATRRWKLDNDARRVGSFGPFVRYRPKGRPRWQDQAAEKAAPYRQKIMMAALALGVLLLFVWLLTPPPADPVAKSEGQLCEMGDTGQLDGVLLTVKEAKRLGDTGYSTVTVELCNNNPYSVGYGLSDFVFLNSRGEETLALRKAPDGTTASYQGEGSLRQGRSISFSILFKDGPGDKMPVLIYRPYPYYKDKTIRVTLY